MSRRLSSEEYVCAKCFGDQGMKDFCLARVENDECDFCGAKGKGPIAAPLDQVIEHINATVHRYFHDPANAGLPYESAEGGWQGETWYTYEVFEELGLYFPNDVDDRLHNAISRGLDNNLWSEVETPREPRGEEFSSAELKHSDELLVRFACAKRERGCIGDRAGAHQPSKPR